MACSGYDEKANVDATIQKFSDNFDIVLFHYDGRTTEWDEVFEWSKEVAHVSARKQTKWWFAKRFLHPSIVAPYDYIFLWDEDLGVENFTAEAYLDIVRKHGLEISQPGLDATNGTTNYDITIKRNDSEIHKTDAARESCRDVHKPPCSGFVEVMAPVFSRDAWRCVWHMIQDPEEQIGIVDAQYLVHHAVPTLQGQMGFLCLITLCEQLEFEGLSMLYTNDWIYNSPSSFTFKITVTVAADRFVEVMAPVFSRDAWRCVWHMIQDPEEQIGIVDAQYLVHHAVPTLQGQGEKEKEGGRSEVRARQFEEMRAFRSRVSDADDELANRTSSIQN
uniref:Uncharacterized protein n=1 Tax=Aegilops tauschii TaxID=37682 RepID=M8AYV6_AEGTA